MKGGAISEDVSGWAPAALEEGDEAVKAFSRARRGKIDHEPAGLGLR